MSLITDILATSKTIDNNRTPTEVLGYSMTELGELAEEVLIKNSTISNHKKEGKDGIVGEAIDLILCAVDLIYLDNPDITEEDIQKIARQKLLKWKQNA
jgi:NTP pyrophosphatase (non-canonical NTP hydrolase)